MAPARMDFFADNCEVLCPEMSNSRAPMSRSEGHEAVEVWFPIEGDSDGHPASQQWEQLWCWPAEAGFRVDNVPFFARGVACGDVISALRTDGGWLCFDKTLARSGNSTFRIWLSADKSLDAEGVLRQLRNLGCRAEVTLERLIAIDVSPPLEEVVWKFVSKGFEIGEWDLQVGYSPN